MANVFVEPRPKSRDENEPTSGYVVEDHADSVLAGPFKTQREAIDRATAMGHKPLVARVRTSD